MAVNVLLVDDSDIIRKMILKTMRLARIPLGDTFEASNGREALEVLEDEWVDVILVDINMPVMDGLELIERVRATDGISDLPIVVITTEGADSSMDRFNAMGVTAFLRKPFTPEQIRDVMELVAGAIVGGEHREMLEDVLGEVLTIFAMMYGEADTTDKDGPPSGDLMRARMSFAGGATGALTVAAPVELCREMAANALGIDVEDERASERAGDAVGELVNMTCGHIATTIEKVEVTKLSPPEVALMSPDEWQALSGGSGTVRFTVDDRPMLASLALRAH